MPGFIKSEMTENIDVKMPFLMETEVAANKIFNAVKGHGKISEKNIYLKNL